MGGAEEKKVERISLVCERAAKLQSHQYIISGWLWLCYRSLLAFGAKRIERLMRWMNSISGNHVISHPVMAAAFMIVNRNNVPRALEVE